MNHKILIVTLLLGIAALAGCTSQATTPANGGVHDIDADVHTGTDGKTVEQRNVEKRLERDNTPGSLKHLYVISAVSGDVLFYSTVDGKVTSSGKRLDPTTHRDCNYNSEGCVVLESMQADGTYGSSIEYLYWFDQGGVYHQIYPSAGTLIHVSDQPISTLHAKIYLG